MLLPQSLAEVLAEIHLVGLPSQQDAGIPVKPQLTSVDAITGLGRGATLARIDFEEVKLALSNAKLDFGETEWLLSAAPDKELGSATFDAVFESVELPKPASTKAADVNPDESTVGERPYRVPSVSGTGLVDNLNKHVAGAVGKLRAVVGLANKVTGTAVGELTGSLTGALKADVTRPPVLDVTPTPEFEWQVTDAFDRPVAVHLAEGHSLKQPAPVFAFLPEFVEFSGPGPAVSERRVSCKVTVKGPDNKTLDKRVIGPVTVSVPQVQIPSVLVMTEHIMDGRPVGDVLVAVPASSALALGNLEQLVEQLVGLLGRLKTTLERLQSLLGLAFGETLDAINDVLDWISSSRVTPIKGTELHDLSAVERDPGGFLGWGGTSWEDCISALVLFGPPGRSITVHNRRNLWVGTGAIRVRVAPLSLVAVVPSLVGPRPAATPEGAKAEVFGLDPTNNFNDVISSFAFEPMTSTASL